MSYGNGGEFDRGNRPINPNAVGSMQPPPAKSNTLWWVLGILGFVIIGGALVCCGGGYFAYQFSSQMAGSAVKDVVANDPAIVEHIGTIENISLNLGATGNAGGGNKVVFDVSGDKGSGQLEVVMDNNPGGQTVNSCVLVLPNGERHDVVIAGQGEAEPETDTLPLEDDAAENLDAAETDPAVQNEAEPSVDEADTQPSVN
ncbi:MAG: hypothetical protein ACO1RT_06015 [Planctomycetaceae bacterium]